ncbi:hypothetical protein M948_05910 [Virgibacillus sp. CM-4]|uniref:O-antigen ligase family protein n=1 Tax=Virgibacillus sp. CM-4 TaxID=1354277 RepID=UPI0003882A5D|nr:O-antigen ligase family protein [Virgibacillus sp. CM-4]EQB38107.1 hypothetical protein M948_05910 [Virgibacillus sp. CM-4]
MKIDAYTRNKLIFVLIIIQPIIDLLTSFTPQFPISIGAFFRAFTMMVLFISLFVIFYRTDKKLLFFLSAAFLGIGISFFLNVFTKPNFIWFSEFYFYLKASYFIVIVFATIYVIQKKSLYKHDLYKATTIASFIVGLSYWLAIITNTSMDSYRYYTSGHSGWFFSANELSVIILILFGILSINLVYNKQLSSWIAYLLLLSMIPMIGTKTAFLGGLILISMLIIYHLWRLKLQIWKDIHASALFVILILFFCLIPYTPMGTNTQPGYGLPEDQLEIDTTEEKATSSKTALFFHKVLSSRDIFFVEIKADYMEANTFRKLFGLGYAGDYQKEPKLVEMDFFDLFFSFGVVASSFILLPIIILGKQLLLSFALTVEHLFLFVIIGLSLGIAFLAGHVLFAPSVISYLAIPLLLLGVDEYDYTETSKLHNSCL